MLRRPKCSKIEVVTPKEEEEEEEEKRSDSNLTTGVKLRDFRHCAVSRV
jgi:hypothetical protein